MTRACSSQHGGLPGQALSLVSCAILCGLLCLGETAAQEPGAGTRLRYRFEPGQSRRCELSLHSETSYEILGREHQESTTLAWVLDCQVVGVNQGTARLDCRLVEVSGIRHAPAIGWLQWRCLRQEGKLRRYFRDRLWRQRKARDRGADRDRRWEARWWDADAASLPAPLPRDDRSREVALLTVGLWSAAVGQSFQVEMTEAGRVTAVEGVAAIRGVMAGGGAARDDAVSAMVEQQLAPILSDRTIQSTLNALLHVLPDQGLAADEEWHQPRELSLEPVLLGRASVDTRLVLAGEAQTPAHHALEQTLSGYVAQPAEPAKGVGGLRGRLLSGGGRGAAQILRAGGWPQDSQLHQDLTGELIRHEAGRLVRLPVEVVFVVRWRLID